MIDSKHISLIKKLLALAKSTTYPAERENALSRVKAVMERHGYHGG